jgi:hypothetical protein
MEKKRRACERARSAGFVFWDLGSTDDLCGARCCGDKLIDCGSESCSLKRARYFFPVEAAAGTRALVVSIRLAGRACLFTTTTSPSVRLYERVVSKRRGSFIEQQFTSSSNNLES